MNKIIVLLICFCAVFAAACTPRVKVENDKDDFALFFPDVDAEECYFYRDYKNPRTAGVGPSMYVVYGVIRLEEEYIDEISLYTWEVGDKTAAFEFLEKRRFNKIDINEEDSLYSKDYVDDYILQYANRIEATYWNVEIGVDFENRIAVCYLEYAFN